MIEKPLTLPCGACLPNRLAKAAMTEGLADPQGRPTPELERLYAIWGAGGAGLLSTVADYGRFLEMIRRGGTLDGVRILSPRTVALIR